MNVLYLKQKFEPAQPFFRHLSGQINLLTCEPEPEEIVQTLDSCKIDAVIGFEEQLNMIKSIIQNFPMINYALISSLSASDFHETTEGYGFFMQLPDAPQQEDAEKFMHLLSKIAVGAAAQAERK